MVGISSSRTAEWMLALGKGTGAKLSYTGRAGKVVDHFSTPLDFTIQQRACIIVVSHHLHAAPPHAA